MMSAVSNLSEERLTFLLYLCRPSDTFREGNWTRFCIRRHFPPHPRVFLSLTNQGVVEVMCYVYSWPPLLSCGFLGFMSPAVSWLTHMTIMWDVVVSWVRLDGWWNGLYRLLGLQGTQLTADDEDSRLCPEMAALACIKNQYSTVSNLVHLESGNSQQMSGQRTLRRK